MRHQATASGHVFCVERKRGPQWYCKYRVGGKQVQKRLGPAWLVGGPPPEDYFTNRGGSRGSPHRCSPWRPPPRHGIRSNRSRGR
jgi:hypothetical protein